MSNSLDCKEIKPVNPIGNQSWIFTGRTDVEAETPNSLATWCEELTHWKRPWCWERLKAGGERDDRGWDGWTASPTPCTRVWASSGRWWWTGKPDVLQSMGMQSWTRLSNWTELNTRNRIQTTFKKTFKQNTVFPHNKDKKSSQHFNSTINTVESQLHTTQSHIRWIG